MGKELTIPDMIANAVIMYDVENVMGNHCYMHAAGFYEEQTERNNSHREDHTVAHSFGGFIGAKSAWDKWNGNLQRLAAEKYDEIVEIYPYVKEALPDITTVTKNAMLESAIHTQASSIVEIADDRKTVRVSMYTPGVIYSVLTEDKKKMGTWLWERYGLEFLYEDGRWVEWHTMVCPDMMGPIDVTNRGRNAYEMQMSGRTRPPILPAIPDVSGPCHREYSMLNRPYDTVPWPKPYETYDDLARDDTYWPKTLD